LARSQNPHLILLDIRLPDVSGFDVCRQLRVEGKRQPIWAMWRSAVGPTLLRRR
jgi:DNA-binding response OmpR family regulator